MALLTTLLQNGAGLSILVTSRERLQLRAETVFTLEGLDCPDPRFPAEVAANPAAQLFLRAARQVDTSFRLQSDQEASDLARLCRQVAGLPLALELAAGWVDVLTVADITQAVSQDIDLLASKLSDIPARQRSIRATIAYSWAQLAATERRGVARLSLFRDGFTRPAAAAVAGLQPEQLSRLVGKSFLRFDRLTSRYIIHELLRQFGAEQLDAAGEVETAKDRFQQYFIDLVGQTETDLKGPQQMAAVNAIRADYENIRQAILWAADGQDYATLDRVVEPLWLYFFGSMNWARAFTLRQQILARLPEPAAPARSPTWYRIAARHVHPRAPERPLLKRALAAAQQQENKREIAFCQTMSGWSMLDSDDLAGSIAPMTAGIEMYRELGDPFLAAVFQILPATAYRLIGQAENSRRLNDATIAYLENAGDQLFILRAYEQAAKLSWQAGDFGGYTEVIARMLAIYQAQTRQRWVAWCHLSLIRVDILKGEFARAAARLNDYLPDLSREENIMFEYDLESAMLANIAGDYQRARAAYQQSLAKNLAIFIRLTPPRAGPYQWVKAIADIGLGDEAQATEELAIGLRQVIAGRELGNIALLLPVAALLLARRGNFTRAVELLALAYHHLGAYTGWLTKWALFADLRHDLETAWGAAEFRAIWTAWPGAPPPNHGRSSSP